VAGAGGPRRRGKVTFTVAVKRRGAAEGQADLAGIRRYALSRPA
jgi:hypothetical protein